jgi:hypothetical protein
MQKSIIITLFFTALGCSQSKFIESNVLTQLDTETIYYDAFQTGIDNFKVEIKSKSGVGVEHLFDYYINDGIFAKKRCRHL